MKIHRISCVLILASLVGCTDSTDVQTSQVLMPVGVQDQMKEFIEARGGIPEIKPGVYRGTAEATVIDTRDFEVQIANLKGELRVSPEENDGKADGLPVGPHNDLTAGSLGGDPRIQCDLRFPGLSQGTGVPPDPVVAVGPEHIVQMVNSQIGFLTKDGDLQFQQTIAGDIASPGFFEKAGVVGIVGDPKCFYDHFTNRFVVTALELFERANIFAISDDSDPNGEWFVYRTINPDEIFFVDFPGFGFDENGFYFVANQVSFGGPIPGVLFRSLRKEPMLSGQPIEFVDLITDANQFPVTSLQAGQHFGGSNQCPFFVSNDTTTTISITALKNPFDSPSIEVANVPVPQYTFAPPVPNGGSASDRLFNFGGIGNAHWRDGSLWTCHSRGEGSRAIVRWYEIETNDWPASGLPTLVQSGDIDAGPGISTFFPAIYSDEAGNAAIVMARSSAADFASVAVTGRQVGDPPGMMAPITTLTVGETFAPMNGDSGTSRWGDYFDIALDPNGSTFWVTGQIQTLAPNEWQSTIDSFTVAPSGGPVVSPSLLTVFRGNNTEGGLAEVLASDDLRAIYNPGFVLNDLEAPVWLIFDGTLPSDSPTVLSFARESNAGTPGLGVTMEAFNWNTASYEEVDTGDESFNTDTVVVANLSSGIADYVEVQSGRVRSRVGWRQTGFTLNFPWEARVDQVGWETN